LFINREVNTYLFELVKSVESIELVYRLKRLNQFMGIHPKIIAWQSMPEAYA